MAADLGTSDEESHKGLESLESKTAIPWLVLLSASREGYQLRKQAREEARQCHHGHLAAQHYERRLRREAIEGQLAAQEVSGMSMSFAGVVELGKELKRLKAEGEEMEELFPPGWLAQHPAWDSVLYDTWVQRLNDLTPMMFVQTVTSLSVEDGQENLRTFLGSLSLELCWDRVCDRLLKGSASALVAGSPGSAGSAGSTSWALTDWESDLVAGARFRVVGHEAEAREARLGALSTQKQRRKMLERISEDKFPKGPGGQGLLKRLGLVAAHLFHRAFHGKNQVVFRASFGITPAVQLLAAPEEDLTLMLKSLIDAGQLSHSFKSVVGRAILAQARERTRVERWLHGLKDLLYVVLLGALGQSLRSSAGATPGDQESAPKAPKDIQIAVGLLLLLSIVVAMNVVSKVVVEVTLFMKSATTCVSGALAAMVRHFTIWNTSVLLMEAFSLWVSLSYSRFVWNVGDGIGANTWGFLEVHPIKVSALVLIRWTLLATSVLQIEPIGRHVVPVVVAVGRPASLFFLLFLGYLVAATFHAYAVLPIEDNKGFPLKAFMKVYRLMVLSDFDMGDLQGLSQQLLGVLNRTTFEVSGTVDDPENTAGYLQMLQGARIEFVVLTLVFTVMVMNVYIGLLSELYSAAAAVQNQLYSDFLASCAYRHMCEKLSLKWAYACCAGCACRQPGPGGQAREGLYWLRYNKFHLVDDADAK